MAQLVGKKPVMPARQKLRLRQYSMTGLIGGWYFRQREVSAGCYVVEGFDLYGHRISRQRHGDPENKP